MILSTREMIDKLISFDTTSALSNLELIDFVEDYLKSHGIIAQKVFNEDGRKANLYATVGPIVTGGVVLSGHTDVVPVEGQPWDTDPFQVVEKEGRLYGRGTCDMKSFSAIALALVPEMIAADLKRPIHFALSYDEEVGCIGAPSMIEEMVNNLPKPRAVIVGEPTSMKITRAHKGIVTLKTEIIGHEAHSSQVHRGVNAVMIGAKLIDFISELMAENKRQQDPESLFEPAYTTLTVGVAAGGTASNILARQCVFHWDIRTIPGDDPHKYIQKVEAYSQELLAEMQITAPETNITTEILSEVPGFDAGTQSEAEMLARQLTGENNVQVVPYAAESGQFQNAGMSTIVCGPGSIDQAHQPNEFIELGQVTACEKMLRKLIQVQAM